MGGSSDRRHSSMRQGGHKRKGKDDIDVIAIAAVIFGALMVIGILIVALQ